MEGLCLSFTTRLVGPCVPCVLTLSPQSHMVVLGNPVEVMTALSLKGKEWDFGGPTEFLYVVPEVGLFSPQHGTVT